MKKTTIFKHSITAVAVSVVLGMSSAAYAANNDGAIAGSITNMEKSILAGASITIKNDSNGFTRTITADSNGNYRFARLPTGVYSLKVMKDGFETTSLEKVTVTLGNTTSVGVSMNVGNVETISVTGSAFSQIDVTSSESSLNIGAVELARLPVGRDVSAVALLAPGTTPGDSRFANSVSFGGASAAENSTYINGLNVTNFRNGLGFSTVPYSFYKEFQVKTGGYSAEFGRATGGVINAVTKSGTNDFHYGAEVFYTPDALQGEGQDTRYPDGRYYRTNSKTEREKLNGSFYASGALIEDTLFVYAMYEARSNDVDYSNTAGTEWTKSANSTDFWGAKVDWQINDDHKVELLAFSDQNDTTYTNFDYAIETETIGDRRNQDTEVRGGDNWSLKYTGYITEDFTVSALYGENEFSLTDFSDVQDVCSFVTDSRATAPSLGSIGCITSAGVEDGLDKREAFRLDFEYALDDHLIRFGLDREVNTSGSVQFYAGQTGESFEIADFTDSRQLPNGFTAPGTDASYVAVRERTVGGDFETIASAFYLEDQWSVTDNFSMTLGIRLETFDNKNSAGDSFAKIDNMIAPRIGFAWDVNGDGEKKIFGSVGRYFLPVANNTNVRLSGNEADKETYYEFDGLQDETLDGVAYQTAILGAQLGEVRVTANGEVPDTRAIVDQDMDAMYQDEIILGFESIIDDNWSWGVKAITRSLNGAIDDMFLGANGFTGTDGTQCQHGDYVLGNPGEDVNVLTDSACFTTQVDGEDVYNHGVQTLETFSTAALGYPTAERKYHSVDLTLKRAWDDVWSLNGTYTWAHSYGNSEGLVKSDNGQGDAGLTTDFDFPELMDGAYGNLPNDRRHQFKVRGAYAVNDELTLSANFTLESGRPKNILGVDHPDGRPAYGSTYYIVDDEGNFSKNPRGSAGETPWVGKLDLSAGYRMNIGDADVNFKVDIFNVLDAHSVRFNQENERFSTFQFPRVYQAPRSVQLSASIAF